MPGLILSHLVNGVVDSVITELLCPSGYRELSFARSGLSLVTFLEIGLRVPDNFPEKLSKL